MSFQLHIYLSHFLLVVCCKLMHSFADKSELFSACANQLKALLPFVYFESLTVSYIYFFMLVTKNHEFCTY